MKKQLYIDIQHVWSISSSTPRKIESYSTESLTRALQNVPWTTDDGIHAAVSSTSPVSLVKSSTNASIGNTMVSSVNWPCTENFIPSELNADLLTNLFSKHDKSSG